MSEETKDTITQGLKSGPPPPILKKTEEKTKKIFPKVEVKEQDFKTMIESRKKEVNTYSNMASSTTEVKSTILPNSKIMLKVIWGDLTKEPVQAIVNAANTNMLHVGGLAKIIVMKGGENDIIQTESLANISKQGFKNSVPPGECIYTSGGQMQCKYVIHSVGPMYFDGQKNEDKHLDNCIINIFRICEELKIESVSIPAISTGIYGFPLEKYTEIVFNRILEIFEKNQVKDTFIKEIRLTNIDEKTMKGIADEFEKRFK